MRRIWVLLLIILYIATVALADQLSAAELTKQDLHPYYRSLRNAIAYQEIRIQKHLGAINQKDIEPTEEQKQDLQMATSMLELKLTLMEKFDKNADNLQNAYVRDLLLSIMEKEVVTGDDLMKLGTAIRRGKS